jgi:hypothetical protein
MGPDRLLDQQVKVRLFGRIEAHGAPRKSPGSKC